MNEIPGPDVKGMKDLLSKLNGMVAPADGSTSTTTITENSSDKEKNIAAMNDLLHKLNEETVYDMERNIQSDTTLQHSIIKESQKGKLWQIVPLEDKTYKVENVLSKECFFESITLFESAKKICSLLDTGSALNSSEIQKVLYYDKTYDSKLTDCKNYKRLYKSAKLTENRAQMNIYSDRFEEAKIQALSIKNNIKKI